MMHAPDLPTTRFNASPSGSDPSAESREAFRLTPSDVEEFRRIVERECAVRLDPQTAWRQATRLVDLVRMLLGPIPEDTGEKPPGSAGSTPVAIAGPGCGQLS